MLVEPQPAAFVGIHNENEFYSHHYLAEVFSGDIGTTLKSWRDAERGTGGEEGGKEAEVAEEGAAPGSAPGEPGPDARLRGLADDYPRFRRRFEDQRLPDEERIESQRDWLRQLLGALGHRFSPAGPSP